MGSPELPSAWFDNQDRVTKSATIRKIPITAGPPLPDLMAPPMRKTMTSVPDTSVKSPIFHLVNWFESWRICGVVDVSRCSHFACD